MAVYIVTGKTGHGKTAYLAYWAKQVLLRHNPEEKLFLNFKISPQKMLRRSFASKFYNFDIEKYPQKTEFTPIEGDIYKKEDRENPNKKILYWQNFSDWFHFQKGIVFCTEGLTYFNARKWETLPDTMQMKFTQHRKDKIDLVFDVQHFSFIEKTLRVLAEKFINVKLKIGSAKFKKSLIPRISRLYEYELTDLNRCENLGLDPFSMTKKELEAMHLQPLWKEWFWIAERRFEWYDTSLKVSESRPEPLKHFERICPDCGKREIKHY